MRYNHFDPDALAETDPGPSKADILTQIEADHFAAKNAGDKDRMKGLDEWHKAVAAAKTDRAARDAYNAAIAAHQAEHGPPPVEPPDA